MPIQVNVKRYYGRFPVTVTTFANQGELTTFLIANSITQPEYQQILTALGYNQVQADTALQAGTLTGEIILQQKALL